MSKFTPTFSDTFEFDGDTITVVMHRLKRKHALKLAPHIKYDEQGEVSLSLSENLELLDMAVPIIKEHLKDLSGLTIEGEELVVEGSKPNNSALYEMVLEETYFITLLGELLSTLMEHSFVGEDKAKK